MRELAFLAVVGAIIAGFLMLPVYLPGPADQLVPKQPPARDTEVIPHDTYVIFKQGDYRTIYVKRAAVSGFATFPNGFDNRGRPVVNVYMGAKEFRFDVPNRAAIEPIVAAFIGDVK